MQRPQTAGVSNQFVKYLQSTADFGIRFNKHDPKQLTYQTPHLHRTQGHQHHHKYKNRTPRSKPVTATVSTPAPEAAPTAIAQTEKKKNTNESATTKCGFGQTPKTVKTHKVDKKNRRSG